MTRLIKTVAFGLELNKAYDPRYQTEDMLTMQVKHLRTELKTQKNTS
jgi:hypothetical protein